MTISHFTAAFLFALLTSVVFAITSKETNRERVFYGLWVFGIFAVVSFGMAWLMFASHR